MRVLATKTLSESPLAYARTLGFDVTCVDFIQTHKVDYSFPDFEFDAIVFTSENAVNYFTEIAEKTAKKVVFSLSGKTNEALLKHNVKADFTAENAELLAEKIIEHKAKNVLHVCGNLALDTLGKTAKKGDFSYTKLITYETEKTAKKGDFSTFDAVLFFSPSGVESFFSVNEIAEKVICAAIGKTTASALKSHTQNQILTAQKTSAEAMFSELKKYFVI